MNIVAVTACPTGIAHSQMGAEALERAATDAGHDITVEVQGAMGTEKALTDGAIESADVAIVAADVRVDTERFSELLTVKVPVNEAVTNPHGLIDRATRTATEDDTSDAITSGSSDDTPSGVLTRLVRLLRRR